jgi:hypothetical protein
LFYVLFCSLLIGTLRELVRAWKDAPADVHQLKEDLLRAERFFGETSEGIHSAYVVKKKHANKENRFSHAYSELEALLEEGTDVLQRIEHFIDDLQKGFGDGVDLGARRRLIWMTSRRTLTRWRSELKGVISNLCRLLIAHNM